MKKKTKKKTKKDIKILCKYDKLLTINEVKPHPRNVNIHPDIQIKGLEKTLKENSIRHPLIISNLSGQLVAGHARLLVMQSLKMKSVPVVYQDFDSEEKEFQFMVADNESQRKSWLDPEDFQINVEELGLDDLELDSFGIFDEMEDATVKRNDSEENQDSQDSPNNDSQPPQEEPPPQNSNPYINCINVYIEEDYKKVIDTLEYFEKKNEPTTYSKIFLDALFHYKKNN